MRPSFRIRKSHTKGKKWDGIFTLEGRTITVPFGATGYEDYTMHKDFERKQRYMHRHAKRESWDDPTTPGALSRWILWNKQSLHASVKDYCRRFGLKCNGLGE